MDDDDDDRASQSPRKRKKNPSFFKVLIQDFSTRLKIPPAFNKVFGKEVPKKVILETCYGKSQEVEVEKQENRFSFCKGWSKFVEENKLENGDFLVFKCASDCSKFKVKVYGKTCCEKKYYCSSEIGKNEAGLKRKREEEKEQEQDNNNVKEEDGTFKAAKRIETDSDSDSDSDYGDKASEDEPINLDSDPDSSQEGEIGNSKQPPCEEEENGGPKSLHSDNQIQFKPERPSFRVKLKSSSISSYLNIPLSFSRKYIKESQSQEIIKLEMANKKVRELGLLMLWGGVGKKKELYGARVTQGWRNLVSEFGLQMGDVCIFELIKPTHDDDDDDDELVFRLHVFRRNHKKFIHII